MEARWITPRGIGDRRRGISLVIAQALCLALVLLVAATQIQVIAQLKLSRTERDYEHALQAAEAGANWYLNRISNGAALGSPITNRSVQAFRQAVKDRTVAVTRYPAGSEQGYYVGYTGVTGSVLSVTSYGWSHGVVRKVTMRFNQQGGLTYAILTGGPIVVSGQPTITSDIHSNTSATFYGNPTINGKVSSTGTVTYNGHPTVTGGTVNGAPSVTRPFIDGAALRSQALANGSSNTSTITSNGPVTLKGLYTGNLSINANPQITIVGTVYVTGSLVFNGNATTTLGNGLIVAGNVIQFNGNGALLGGDGLALVSLGTSAYNTYPPAVQFNSNMRIKGVIYAPNGYVQVNGQINLTGSIVADSLQINGNPTITRNANYTAPSAIADDGYDLLDWRDIE